MCDKCVKDCEWCDGTDKSPDGKEKCGWCHKGRKTDIRCPNKKCQHSVHSHSTKCVQFVNDEGDLCECTRSHEQILKKAGVKDWKDYTPGPCPHCKEKH